MELLTTTLTDVEYKSGEYPVALSEAVSLLVAEQKDSIPVYMPGSVVNSLELNIEAAKLRDGEVGEVIESLNAAMAIQASRGQIKGMLREMALERESSFALCALLSDDLLSSNPAITKPEDPSVSFQFRPKTFDLGLTGRLLEDDSGQMYQERLRVQSDIYEAFHLATDLHPQRVVAIGNHGQETVVYEEGKVVGKKETLDKPQEKVLYVFNEDRCERWGLSSVRVLPTDGLKVVSSGFYEQIKRYGMASLLFGHRYSSKREFLEMSGVLDRHLIWKLIANFSSQYDGFDAPLIDCERLYGIENKDGESFPENKNRLQLIPDRIYFHLGRVSLYFDVSAAVQSLMNLGDIVTDVWCEPVDRNWDQGWDIVYDRQRGITPDNPVAVMSAADAARYAVLK